jgi:hypothetical protein
MAGVDVLLTMELAVMPLREAGEYVRAKDMDEARAAVAELIDFVALLADGKMRTPAGDIWVGFDPADVVAGARSALARVGGAP